jgi:sarcosine oxidase
MSEKSYDVAVVGAGMFGSAAARYLSAAGLQTLVIGPAEPETWSGHTGVFASHYDEARITRVVDPDPLWGELAARSIAQYPVIEEKSGIRFHSPVGCLRVEDLNEDGSSSQQDGIVHGRAQGAQFEVLSGSQTMQGFPGVHFPEHVDGVWECGAAGYINPRRLVAAQLQIAQQQGARLVRQIVQEIIPGQDAVEIKTREGETYHAAKVLIAAGAYSKLLSGETHPEWIAHLVQVLLAEVEGPMPELPCIIYCMKGHPLLDHVYLLPPVLYPDGKWYLKMGSFMHRPRLAHDAQAIQNWFAQAPEDEETAATRQVLREMLPGLKILYSYTKPCVWTFSPQTRPIVKVLEDADDKGRIVVASGDCGRSAKSSDAIGKWGAELLIGHSLS